MTDAFAEARKLLVREGQRLQRALTDERTRKRAAIVRRLHEVRRMIDGTYHYSSQAGQDQVVDILMRQQRNGTFLDIGGYDGVTGSNTFFLETFRGWTGALIEPVPAQLDKSKQVRRCPCLGLAIAAEDGAADFIEVSEGYTQMSGLAGSYDGDLLKTVRENKKHKERVFRIETRTMWSIMQEYGLVDVDFVSLDIEGGELEVLRGFPFEKARPLIWSIENNTADGSIREIMSAHGYRLVEFCGPDEIYHLVEN